MATVAVFTVSSFSNNNSDILLTNAEALANDNENDVPRGSCEDSANDCMFRCECGELWYLDGKGKGPAKVTGGKCGNCGKTF